MNLIIRPIITEKSMKETANNKFTFQVYRFANKKEIKKAIEKTFNVNVVAITTGIVKGKTRRFGKRQQEQTLSSQKKAVVKLKSGQKIAMFEAAQ